MKKIAAILFAVLFIISTYILIFIYSYEEGIDPEYAVSVFDQDVVTREFEFSEFDRLYFLYDRDPITEFSKKTKLLDATPFLKIVNSDEYRVEIKSNRDAFDSLKIATCESADDGRNSLVITFSDECYVPVHIDDNSYDYDTGLYVDFDVFEVTVYAPISSLYVDSKVILDYQAPTCEKMLVFASSDGIKANIYDIDANNFTLSCHGNSDVTLSGKVTGKSTIRVFHQTKVHANDLDTNTKDFTSSSSVLFGFSYIEHNDTLFFDFFENIITLTVAAVLYLPPVIWLACFICCLRKKRT